MRQGNSSTSFKPRVAALVLVVMFFPGAGLMGTTTGTPLGVDQQEQKRNDKAEDAFVRARELFDEENWNAAVAAFEQYLVSYPQDRNVPAAYYWLAMTLKKQSKYVEADERLARLLNEFPQSNWANDARALRVEIAGLTNNKAMIVQSTTDENENVKLAALQSLLRLEPERALKMIADVLRPTSGESLKMKLSVLTLLGRGVGKAAVPVLSQVINDQTETELRVRAIYALAQIDDPNVFNVLKGASSSSDKRVAEASLFTIAHLPGQQPAAFISEQARRTNSSPGARHQSILLLGQQQTEAAVDELLNIYATSEDVATRKQTVMALSLSQNPRAQSKLLEIARQQDGDAELRSQAILALGQRNEAKTLDSLAQLYDQEKNEDIKRWIILALAQSNERSATRKLMAIARSDPSERLRRMAVLSLQRSNDPEVQKFLQELN